MEEEFTKEKAVSIFKQRITDLSEFERFKEEDIESIQCEKRRGIVFSSKRTLELNKHLLNTFMGSVNSRLC